MDLVTNKQGRGGDVDVLGNVTVTVAPGNQIEGERKGAQVQIWKAGDTLTVSVEERDRLLKAGAIVDPNAVEESAPAAPVGPSVTTSAS